MIIIVIGEKIMPTENQKQSRVPSSHVAELSDRMIDKSNIKLLELIGQGEYTHMQHDHALKQAIIKVT